ncbi:MAG TPA: Ig-like domain-containing protein [Solirubrobacter sp.]|nr:Ig-like domain-containing protein [Solirubrobacter sp.]
MLPVLLASLALAAEPPRCVDGYVVTPVNAPLTLPAPDCTGTGPLTRTIVTAPALGTLEGDVYTPQPGFRGEDHYTYRVSNADGQSELATVTILVNTAPVCRDGEATIESGQQLVIEDFACDEADGDEYTVWFGNPMHGELDVEDDGTIVYTPDDGWVGTDSFTYYADEDDARLGLASEDATMRITVTGVSVPAPPAAPAPPQVPAPAPVLVPAPAPADVTPPSVVLKNATRKRSVAVRLTIRESVTARLTLTLDKKTARKLRINRTVGELAATLAPGTRKLPIKLTTRARKALNKRKRVKLTLTAVVTDRAGNRTTKRLTVTLKR